MKALLTTTTLAALLAGVAASAQEKIELEVFHAWPGHARFHKPMAEAFMAENSDVTVTFRAPGADYGVAHLAVLRGSLSGDMPDVFHSGLNLVAPLGRILSARGAILPLDDLMAAEGEGWVEANYEPNFLAIGAVDGVQYGLPFNASTPIVHYNATLIREAGGDPDDLPSDWDELIELAGKIDALGDDVWGMSYDVHDFWDDWLFQALIKQQGGEIMNEAETEVAWNNEIGMRAVDLAVRFVEEGGMPLISKEESTTLFCSGQKGLHFTSTAGVRGFGECSDGNFEYVTGLYPVENLETGGVATGGNVGVILASDSAKQEAAWRYIKFISGPKAQEMAVLATGYMPTNKLATGPDHLGDFYAENPNWQTSVDQIGRAQPYYGYPGTNGVKIGRVQMEIFGELMAGEISKEEALAALVEETEALLPPTN